MKNETKAPMTSQPDNKPMSYGGGSVKPMNAKRSPGAAPSPAGKSSAPWQAGHGTGVPTDFGCPEVIGKAPNMG